MLISFSRPPTPHAWREPHQVGQDCPAHLPTLPHLLLRHHRLHHRNHALAPFLEASLQVQVLYQSSQSSRYRPNPNQQRCPWATISSSAAAACLICLWLVSHEELCAPLSNPCALCLPHLILSCLHRQLSRICFATPQSLYQQRLGAALGCRPGEDCSQGSLERGGSALAGRGKSRIGVPVQLNRHHRCHDWPD